MNNHFITKILQSGFLAVSLLSSIAGCSTGVKKAESAFSPIPAPSSTAAVKPLEVMGPPEPMGPLVVPSSKPNEVFGPEPIQLRPLVLILGPGAARGMAHAGVLRALHDAKIPIGAIIATETGSLIGALYSLNGTINKFEWALQQLKDETLTEKKAFLSSLLGSEASGNPLEESLKQIFGKKDLRDCKIPLKVTLSAPKSSAPFFADHGSIALAVRAAMALPGVMRPREWMDSKAMTAASVRPYPVSEGRQLGIGPVVVIDVIGDTNLIRVRDDALSKKVSEVLGSAERAASADLKDADLVIRPNLKGVGYLDYDKRTSSAFQGKAATNAQLRELRHLVGLPENE